MGLPEKGDWGWESAPRLLSPPRGGRGGAKAETIARTAKGVESSGGNQTGVRTVCMRSTEAGAAVPGTSGVGAARVAGVGMARAAGASAVSRTGRNASEAGGLEKLGQPELLKKAARPVHTGVLVQPEGLKEPEQSGWPRWPGFG